MRSVPAREDRLGRFAPTPLSAALCVMGRSLTLETNSAAVLRQARRAFEPYGVGSREQSEFLWRIVSETRESAHEAWPEAAALASGRLRLAHFGRDCFFAADLDAREAMGYIPESLAEDESVFCGTYLAAAFQGTASALRLTQLSAACLALAGKALLLFGPSPCDKTEVSRLAAQFGLELHSHQTVFIDLASGIAKAWGQFRPGFAGRPIGTVTPVLGIFLEPENSQVPRLTPLPGREYSRRLREEVRAGDAGRATVDEDAVARALSNLPAYRLAYGRDPVAAAVFLHSMLKTHNLLEAQS